MPARMTWATLRNLGLSWVDFLRLLIDLVNVNVNQSRTCVGTASAAVTSLRSSSSSHSRLQDHTRRLNGHSWPLIHFSRPDQGNGSKWKLLGGGEPVVCGSRTSPFFTAVSTNVDNFYNIWHIIYQVYLQRSIYWFTRLTYVLLLHYLGKRCWRLHLLAKQCASTLRVRRLSCCSVTAWNSDVHSFASE